MNRNIFINMWSVVLSITMFASYVATMYAAAAPKLITTNNTWTDNFEGASLNSRWSWIREDPTHWSLTSNPGFLHIITQQGGLLNPGGDAKNLLLTSAPYGDYQITTKVTVDPFENFQGAGIFVYQDDDNWLIVTRRYGNANKVTMRKEVNGVFDGWDVLEDATTIYLRIARAGDAYTGLYSIDGLVWITIGEYNLIFNHPKIGIGSQNGPSLLEIPTDYDFFNIVDYTHYLFLPLTLKN